MSVRNQLKLLVGGINARRSGRPPPVAPAAWSEFLERSRLVAALIFIVTVAVIVLISSAGVSTLNVPVLRSWPYAQQTPAIVQTVRAPGAKVVRRGR